jgi:hypothetical protein
MRLIRWFFGMLAKICFSFAAFCDGLAKPAHPFPLNKSPEYKKEKLSMLLAKDELSEEEQKELSCLVSEFEGGVLFLDSFRGTTEVR